MLFADQISIPLTTSSANIWIQRNGYFQYANKVFLA